jgi:LPPG:FO 2-phospho-L-lactate transferase
VDINLDDSGSDPGVHQSSTPIALLSGGVGGARLARGLAPLLGDDLTVIVNVGDDEEVYGVHVSADLDTVLYTLAGREGPHGWGLAGDTFTVIDTLGSLGADTAFRLGDRDLAHCLHRTERLRRGDPLSSITADVARALGVTARLVPATDERLRTIIETDDGERLAFQEYFVTRRHRDAVDGLHFDGAPDTRPAPGVLDAIDAAVAVVIAPSNPPLSIWPILAVPGIRGALERADRVIAVSPLFGGKALKGPAEAVMRTLGLAPGNAGVLAAYDGIITDLVIDRQDAEDADHLEGDVRIHVEDTRIGEPAAAIRFAEHLLRIP